MKEHGGDWKAAAGSPAVIKACGSTRIDIMQEVLEPLTEHAEEAAANIRKLRHLQRGAKRQDHYRKKHDETESVGTPSKATSPAQSPLTVTSPTSPQDSLSTSSCGSADCAH